MLYSILELYLQELGAPSISSSFSISKVQDIFDDDGGLLDQSYEKRVYDLLKNLNGT